MTASIHTSPEQPAPERAGDACNLRAWFAGYLLWLGLLTGGALWGLAEVDRVDSTIGWCVWLLSLYAFYMSLCCTFFPAPTTWFVLLVASDAVAVRIGLADGWAARAAVVATLGALSTGLANLNEYHVFTYLLRYRRVARLKQMRVYKTAANWFATSPFAVIVLFAFIPISVDVVRWLAITFRYPRLRFFAAYFAGRWARYAMLALSAIWLDLGTWQIVGIQAALAVLVLGRIIQGFVRKMRRQTGGEAANGRQDAPPVVQDVRPA